MGIYIKRGKWIIYSYYEMESKSSVYNISYIKVYLLNTIRIIIWFMIENNIIIFFIGQPIRIINIKIYSCQTVVSE